MALVMAMAMVLAMAMAPPGGRMATTGMSAGPVTIGSRRPLSTERQLRPQPLPLPRCPTASGSCSNGWKKNLPGHELALEARINGFPVDILIDDRVCVEVDGPDHFVDQSVEVPELPGRVSVKARRTKDLFIDHMLCQYGYLVFRIVDEQDPAQFDALIRQVGAVLTLTGAGSDVCQVPAAGEL